MAANKAIQRLIDDRLVEVGWVLIPFQHYLSPLHDVMEMFPRAASPENAVYKP